VTGTGARRRTAAGVALLVAGVTLSACADRGARPPADTAVNASDAGVTSTLVRTVTGAVDLRRLVVTRAPASYEPLPSPPYGDIDLQSLLTDFSDAPDDDRVILRDAGFTRGYTRGWLQPSPRSFSGVFVFEFADEAGAHLAADRFAAQNVTRKGATPFPVATIDGAAGQSYTQQSDDGVVERVHIVTFVRGPRLYQVGGQFPDPAASPDPTVTFAETEARVAA